MVATPDPVESGLVPNLARPGANVTGTVSSGREVATKRIALLKRLVPRLAKLAVIERHGGDAVVRAQREKDFAALAVDLGLTWQAFSPAVPEDYDAIFVRLAAEGFNAAYVEPGPVLDANQARVASLAVRHRIPTVGDYPYHAENGLLMVYDEDANRLNESAAGYIDKILRGAKPGDLPVEAPIKFNLVVNLKTAKALGIPIPDSFKLLANKVVQ